MWSTDTGSQRASRFDRNFTHIKKRSGPREKENRPVQHVSWNMGEHAQQRTRNLTLLTVTTAVCRSTLCSISPTNAIHIAEILWVQPVLLLSAPKVIFIPDLAAMVVIIDSKINRPPFSARWKKKTPKGYERDASGVHRAARAHRRSEGSIYVVDGSPDGRPRKFAA